MTMDSYRTGLAGLRARRELWAPGCVNGLPECRYTYIMFESLIDQVDLATDIASNNSSRNPVVLEHFRDMGPFAQCIFVT